MHKIKFYPVGNGDTSQIILENGKRILFDFRHVEGAEQNEGPEINLYKQLKDELEETDRNYFDVVAFTHGDQDHIENSTNFFELEYKSEFQGEDRIKIKELWVPAAMIIETVSSDQLSDEFSFWRQEARYRLKRGSGIRVFSKPDKLKEWLEGEDLTLDERKHLITDAGQLVPGFSLADDGVEFFCHSPFIKNVDDGEDLRNSASLIFNIRFQLYQNVFDYFCVGDTDFNALDDIITISKIKGNEDRLNWDVFNIPHHCSYKALSTDKGEKETAPTELIKELLLKGKIGSFMVCSSIKIPDIAVAYEQKMPPHIQAKKCYLRYLNEINGGQFLVTMEESPEKDPKPITIEIGNNGLSIAYIATPGIGNITSRPTPRAGV